jgi:hypothetical protein
MYANVILAVAEAHLADQRSRATRRRLVREAKLIGRQSRASRSGSRRAEGVRVHTECS